VLTIAAAAIVYLGIAPSGVLGLLRNLGSSLI
jgi:hypothetical protein